MPALRAFNFRNWIDENRHLLKPPVGNKQVFRDSEFIIMVVGGPNSRKDFHVDPGEEFFYQLEGDMLLKTVQDGKIIDVPIREGEILLLPPNVPHSPRRFANTIGLVIERERRPDERDGFQWYCERCDHLLYEEFEHISDIEKQLPPIFERFFKNTAHRTCKNCGTVLEPRPGDVTVMNYGASLDFAQSADETDPLRRFRARFAMPTDATGRELRYFAGHSLGAMPLAVRDVLNEELDDWARFGVFGHEEARRPWIPYHENLTAGLCALTGAQPNEVVAMGSLTANLHMMLASFYRPAGARRKILIEAGAFTSDRHAMTSQIAWHDLDPAADLIELAPAPGEDLVPESAIEACLAQAGASIALVLWPGVQFRTGQAFDLQRISAAAHRAGAIAGFDLAHSIGNTPLSLHDDDADFAVWCSYKYLNAGPGAIGGVFVHSKHVDTRPRLSGWWGHDATTRFEMKPEFRAHAGAAGWAVSNPSIFAAAPLIASLALFREAGVERLREKSLELTGYLEFLLDRLGSVIQLITPRDTQARGCQLSFRIVGSGRGAKVFRWLTANGVACDWREPDVIRASPIPLYNSFEDVYRFGEKLQQALEITR